jgi:hypothetical protein
MPDQAGLCMTEWKAAKKQFENKTDKKKPSKKFLGVRVGNDLEAILKKMDSVYDAAVREHDDAKAMKHLQNYKKLVDKFEKARKDYKTVLQKAAAAEAEKDQLVKEITVLSKTLSMIEAGARINVITKIQIAEKNLSSGPKADSKEEKQRQMMIDTAKKMVPALQSGIKNGALFAAKVKADPTPATFNEGIQSAARKINQNIANIPKIYKATGDTLGVSTKKAAAIAQVMDAWGAGTRKVKDNADAKAVLRELGAYVQMLNACKALQKELIAAGKTKK